MTDYKNLKLRASSNPHIRNGEERSWAETFGRTSARSWRSFSSSGIIKCASFGKAVHILCRTARFSCGKKYRSAMSAM